MPQKSIKAMKIIREGAGAQVSPSADEVTYAPTRWVCVIVQANEPLARVKQGNMYHWHVGISFTGCRLRRRDEKAGSVVTWESCRAS